MNKNIFYINEADKEKSLNFNNYIDFSKLDGI